MASNRIHASAKGRAPISFTVDVELKAAAQDEQGKASPRKFAVNAYNGGALQVNRWDNPVVIDLKGLQFARSITANLHHMQEMIVGHVTEKAKTDAELTLGGVVSGTGEAAKEFMGNADNGYPWQASVEVQPLQILEVKAGDSVTVNGQQFSGPVSVAKKSKLYGVAFLPRGADEGTSVSLAASGANKQEFNMDPKFKAWIEAMGFDPADLSDKQIESLEAQYKGLHSKPADKPKEPSTLDEVLAAQKKENERREKIAEITARALQSSPNHTSAIEVLARQADEEKWDAGKYELELYRAKDPSSATFRPRPSGQRGVSGDVIEAAICKFARMPNIEGHFDERTLDACDKAFPRGICIRQAMMIAAESRGVRIHDPTDLEGMLMAAFPDRRERRESRMIQASGFSTISIPGILSNVANKFSAQGFMSVEQSWRQIAKIRSVNDFKAISSYAITGSLESEKLGPTGEIKHGQLGEESYSNRADTYAKMLAITRQDIVNDDLNKLADVPRMLGRGQALKLNTVFWTEFLDDSLLNLAGLANATTLFDMQTDPDGKPLGVSPAIVLVPPQLYPAAFTLLMSDTLNLATSTAASTGTKSPWTGMFRLVKSVYLPRIGSTAGQKAWYLLADPNDLAVIEVAFLFGRDVPFIETADADFDSLGIQMRTYHDFGVAKQEYRAGVKEKGEN